MIHRVVSSHDTRRMWMDKVVVRVMVVGCLLIHLTYTGSRVDDDDDDDDDDVVVSLPPQRYIYIYILFILYIIYIY
jgi:hypothetical protein